MSHKWREGGLKVQHGIIQGLKPILKKILNLEPNVVSRIIPGEIKNTKGHGDAVNVRVTVGLYKGAHQTGWKAIGLAGGLRQEIFLSTNPPHPEKKDIEHLFSLSGAKVLVSAEDTAAAAKKLNSNEDFPVCESRNEHEEVKKE
jgi:hypothetical protein